VPFDVLDQLVDRWIADEQSRARSS
jgi:hypothetical protein